jgi:hypothetical protein
MNQNRANFIMIGSWGYRDSGTPRDLEAWIVYEGSKRSLAEIPLLFILSLKNLRLLILCKLA